MPEKFDKFDPNKDEGDVLRSSEVKNWSIEFGNENSEVQQSDQLPRPEIVAEFLTVILTKDSRRHSLKGRVRNALSTAWKNIKWKLKCC